MNFRNTSIASIEWQSMGLLVVVYLAWTGMLWLAAQTSLFWFAPLLAYVVALHTSLQHEFLHGHPTRIQWLNDVLVFLPLVLWLSYSSYKKNHLIHHQAERLTHPLEDPESYYFLAQQWSSMSSFQRALFNVNNSFTGRMLVGPLIAITQAFSAELHSIQKEGLTAVKRLAPHIVGMLLIFTLLVLLGISIWAYLLLVIWPATSLMLLRSYYEHRPDINNDRCTAIVETNPLLGLLFLNNNLHLVHHQNPGLAWYKIPAVYRKQRDKLLQQNDGYLVRGYAELLFKFAFRAKDKAVYNVPLFQGVTK